MQLLTDKGVAENVALIRFPPPPFDSLRSLMAGRSSGERSALACLIG